MTWITLGEAVNARPQLSITSPGFDDDEEEEEDNG